MRMSSSWQVGLGLAMAVAVTPYARAEGPKPKSSEIRSTTPDKETREKARAHMTAGVSYVNDPSGAKWEEALAEFQKAYSYVQSWLIVGNIGTAALHLERDQEALEYYTKYLAEGGKRIKADERKQVEADIARLKASIVQVTVTTDAPDVTFVDERMAADGKSIVNRYSSDAQGPTRLGIHPGHHRMTARAGEKQLVWQFNAEPGATLSHEFEFASTKEEAAKGQNVQAGTPQPTTKRSEAKTSAMTKPAPDRAQKPGWQKTAGWVTLAVGAAGVAAGGVTGILAMVQRKDANASDVCENDYCSSGGYDRVDSVNTLRTVSTVSFIAGGVVLGAGAALLLTAPRERSRERPATSRGARVTPWLGVGSVGVTGTF
jgi:hypothetical protein